jgi:hypothetical protein
MAEHGDSPRSVKLLLGVLLGWVFSAAFVAGPWVAIVVLLPEAPPWVHPTYWLCMAAYLLSALAFNPSPDMTELGLGGTLINNPFSFEDDANRALLKWALFLWPGKLVWWTLLRTWGLVRG